MLTCPWCGLRPTDEFVLLECVSSCGGSAPDSSLIVGERWWHRLGCGRPFVVRQGPVPRLAAMAGRDSASAGSPDDDGVGGRSPQGESAQEPLAEVPPLPPLLAKAEREAEAGEMDPGWLDAVAVAGVTVDLAGDPPLEYRRPMGVPDAPADAAAEPPEERPSADRPTTDLSAAAASDAPFSFNFFGSAAALLVDDGNGMAEATGWEEEDLAVDRFRSGPRRERARELNRPTRPPTPARTGPGGTPREVLVTRRSPIAYGSAPERDPGPVGPGPAPAVGSGSPAAHGSAADGPVTGGAATGGADAPATDAAGHQRSSLFARAGSDQPTGPGTPPSGTGADAAFAGALEDAVVEAPPGRATRSAKSRRIGLFDDRPPRGGAASEAGDR